MIKTIATLAALVLCGAALTACADQEPEPPPTVTQILDKIIPNQRPDNIRAALIPGFYEVSYGADIFYVSGDGRYALHGDLVDLTSRLNVTEARRTEVRTALLKKLDTEGAIIFAPRAKPRHVIYVFTDVDCNYCRQLHREIAQYNDRGIEVRYLAYPRSGPDTPSYYKMVSVWCASDRKSALTRAKAGQTVTPASCANPVREHMALAENFGVSGTPTLILPDGSPLPGYVPPERLAAYLDEQFGNN